MINVFGTEFSCKKHSLFYILLGVGRFSEIESYIIKLVYVKNDFFL